MYMRKPTNWIFLIIVCIGIFSFKKKCNNVDDESFFKKEVHGTVPGAAAPNELSLSPLLNLLEI